MRTGLRFGRAIASMTTCSDVCFDRGAAAIACGAFQATLQIRPNTSESPGKIETKFGSHSRLAAMTPPRRHAGDILHLLPGHALPITLGRTTRGRGIQYAVTAT